MIIGASVLIGKKYESVRNRLPMVVSQFNTARVVQLWRRGSEFPGASSWRIGKLADINDERNGARRRWRHGSIRELLLCMVVIALASGWFVDRNQLEGKIQRDQAASQSIAKENVILQLKLKRAFGGTVPMTSQHNQPAPWRPKFSIRTLIVIVTFVCCYAACWGPTKSDGVQDVYRHANPELGVFDGSNDWSSTSAAVPLVVEVEQYKGPDHRECYFWFFGCVVKLPFEGEIDLPPVEAS